MKTKILFLLLFVITCSNSFADVIIGLGCRPRCYKEVIYEDNHWKCVGTGRIWCAAIDDFNFKVAGIAVPEITNYVMKEIQSGHSEGQINFNGVLPCEWRMIDDENFEIRIKADKIDKVE